jgi:hypothetical protein
MAKKVAKTRSPASNAIGAPHLLSVTANVDDTDDNPPIPPGGMAIRRYADGSLMVRSENQVFTLGTPTALARKSGSRGGFVVAGVTRATVPDGAIAVGNADELMDRLKLEISKAKPATGNKLKKLNFRLKGSHTLDLHKLSSIVGSSSNVFAHILVDPDDNPQVPPGA